MSAFITPRHDHCASCEIRLTGWPVYRRDEPFCCPGCADGGPCSCTYEADLAQDGVDGLGMPFLLPGDPRPDREPSGTPVEPSPVTSSVVGARS